MGLFQHTKNQQVTPRGKVMAFINQKGGVGKTTMAFNTAHALAHKGHKVLCIDMDPQGNLSLLFTVDAPSKHIHHLLINSLRELKAMHIPALYTQTMVRVGKVDLIPAGQELSGLELTVAGINSPRQLILKKFLEKNAVLEQYDYVIIDGPPTLGLLVVNILCACDGVMIPFRPDEFSKKGLHHFYNVLEDIADMGIVTVPQILAHIPNLIEGRRKQESAELEKMSDAIIEEFGAPKLVMPFKNKASLSKALAQNKSVFDFSSKEYLPLQGQFNTMADIIINWQESYHG